MQNYGMNASFEARSFAKHKERLVLYAYDDLGRKVNGAPVPYIGGKLYGTLTIGWGHTGRDVKPGMEINADQAQRLFDADVQKSVDSVRKRVKVPLTQGQFDALWLFDMNCGSGNLERLIVPLNKGNYDLTRQKFALYINSKGKPLEGLRIRRKAETSFWDGYRYKGQQRDLEDHEIVCRPVDRPKGELSTKDKVKRGAAAVAGSGAAVGSGVAGTMDTGAHETAAQHAPSLPLDPSLFGSDPLSQAQQTFDMGMQAVSTLSTIASYGTVALAITGGVAILAGIGYGIYWWVTKE